MARSPCSGITAILAGAAAQADNGGKVAVQRNHGAAAGGLVQTINVLGDDPSEVAGGFERRQAAVHIVGLGAREVPPPQVGAGPIAAAGVVVTAKLLVGHGAMVTERAVRAPIVGNAGVGGHPGAGDNQHVSSL